MILQKPEDKEAFVDPPWPKDETDDEKDKDFVVKYVTDDGIKESEAEYYERCEALKLYRQDIGLPPLYNEQDIHRFPRGIDARTVLQQPAQSN